MQNFYSAINNCYLAIVTKLTLYDTVTFAVIHMCTEVPRFSLRMRIAHIIQNYFFIENAATIGSHDTWKALGYNAMYSIYV